MSAPLSSRRKEARICLYNKALLLESCSLEMEGAFFKMAASSYSVSLSKASKSCTTFRSSFDELRVVYNLKFRFSLLVRERTNKKRGSAERLGIVIRFARMDCKPMTYASFKAG